MSSPLIANELEVSVEELLKDNLATADKKTLEIERILLGCSPEEERILTKNMKDLRETSGRTVFNNIDKGSPPGQAPESLLGASLVVDIHDE